MRITMEFKVPARIRKKGKWFISSCPLLDVHSQGYTRNEAEHNLVDALSSFLISCYERGTLGEVLPRRGTVR
jgi:predicted RNase H-like HicB family nuclease